MAIATTPQENPIASDAGLVDPQAEKNNEDKEKKSTKTILPLDKQNTKPTP